MSSVNLGHRVVHTAGVAEDFPISVTMACLFRHSKGDWGDTKVYYVRQKRQ